MIINEFIFAKNGRIKNKNKIKNIKIFFFS